MEAAKNLLGALKTHSTKKKRKQKQTQTHHISNKQTKKPLRLEDIIDIFLRN